MLIKIIKLYKKKMNNYKIIQLINKNMQFKQLKMIQLVRLFTAHLIKKQEIMNLNQIDKLSFKIKIHKIINSNIQINI